MNKEQMLLTLLSEECTEVGQRASKAIRFGLDEIQKGQELTNRERLHQELVDIIAVVQYLNYGYDFDFDFDNIDWKAVAEKKERIDKYMKYSSELGRVEL